MKYLKEYKEINWDEDWEEEEEEPKTFTYVSWYGNISNDIYIITEKLGGDNVIIFNDFKHNDCGNNLIPLTEKQIIDLKKGDYEITMLNHLPKHNNSKFKYSELIKIYPEFKL